MMRIAIVIAALCACKDKPKNTPPATTSSAAPVTIDAAAAIAIDAPSAKLPDKSTRNGPWGIDARTDQTVANLATVGYKTTPNAPSDRSELDAALVDNDDDGDARVTAYAPHDKPVAWFETSVSEAVNEPAKELFVKAHLCVEDVCPGEPIADASKLGIKQCETFRIEMVFRFKCAVPGSQLLVIAEAGDFRGAKDGKAMAFDKLVAAKLPIHALAWERNPGAWQPVDGCTTDCD